MRQLATIQKIKEINSIPNADSIEVATILGWKVVVKKDEFKVNDYCVYCEIDSILPEKQEFEFLRNKKFRIKTIRLRGQISQGICFPISILPSNLKIEEKLDVTEILGITLHEDEISAQLIGKIKGNFPSFLIKSDETRVQVLQNLLNKYKGTICYISEKIDGSSSTFYFKDNIFSVCSRNIDLLESSENKFWELARKYDLENKMKKFYENTNIELSLQGELVGPGIQSNRLKLSECSIRFFNVFDIQQQHYFDYEHFVAIIHELELETVPIISTFYELDNDIDKIIEMSKGRSLLNCTVQREGIVIRPKYEIQDQEFSEFLKGNRVSFKAINPEYLLKHNI